MSSVLFLLRFLARRDLIFPGEEPAPRPLCRRYSSANVKTADNAPSPRSGGARMLRKAQRQKARGERQVQGSKGLPEKGTEEGVAAKVEADVDIGGQFRRRKER